MGPRVLKAIARVLAATIVLLAVVYAGEDLILRYRVGRKDPAVFDSVIVYDEGEVKGGKVEYYMDQPQPQTCVHAMFPHFGDAPCWYLTRHTLRRIALSSTGFQPVRFSDPNPAVRYRRRPPAFL